MAAKSKTCSVEGCNKNAIARSLCRNHYATARRHGEFIGVQTGKYKSVGTCRVPECGRQGHLWKGFCCAHYKRFLRHGDPHGGGTSMGAALDWLEAHKDYPYDDHCLIWPFARLPTGYGTGTFKGHRRNASRSMCILAHGDPPTPRHEAAHTCGKGHEGCVNPNHLCWKTAKENQADRIVHDTHNRGERQWGARLTAADVRRIRARAKTERICDIAKSYNVHQSHVSKIVHRKGAWEWLD